MTYPIAADVEELVVAYLVGAGLPSTNVGVEMLNTTTYPFYLVQRVAGGDDMITDHATVSVHTFHTSRNASSLAARNAHRLMRQWTAKNAVTVSTGTAFIDWILTLESPTWRNYEDKTLQRYCARYLIDLRLNQTT
jgi:hypothetical protein